jgi:hypothetical protein
MTPLGISLTTGMGEVVLVLSGEVEAVVLARTGARPGSNATMA